jgi:hypothetical protein
MINNELSKSQKRIARTLISKSLESECGKFLGNIRPLLITDKNDEQSNHELYIKRYRLIHKFDKHLAYRYDNLRGSNYFITVLELYMENVLKTEDLADFNEDEQNRLIGLKNHFK